MTLVSGGKKILLHNSAYELQHSYGDFTEPIRGLDWSYDSKYLLATTPSGIIEILKPSLAKVKNVQKVRVKNCSAAVFYKNTHQFVGIGCSSGVVCVWDTKSQNIHKKFPSLDCAVTSLDISSTDAHLSVGGENGEVVLYGISSNSKMQNFTFPNLKRKITSVKFSKISRSTLGATNEAGGLAVWDVFKKKVPIYTAEAHHTICSDMAFSPVNLNFLLSVGYDNLLNMYDNRKSNPVCSKNTEYALTAVSMSPDGVMVACSHRRGGIVIYDLRNAVEPFLNIAPHTGVVTTVRYKPVADVNFVQPEPPSDYSIETNNISVDNMRSNGDGEHFSYTEDTFLKMISETHSESPNCSEINKPESSSALPKQDSFLAALGIGNTIGSPHTPDYSTAGLDLESHFNIDDQPNTSTPTEVLNAIPLDKQGITIPIEQQEVASPTIIPVDMVDINKQLETISNTMCDTLKSNSYDVMQHVRTNLMSLYLSMCKQHFAVMDRLDNMDTGNNSDIHSEIKKLRAENEVLRYENEYLRNERAKYMPENIN